MRDYTLSKEKIAELEKLHRSLRDKRQADRVKAVIALAKGWSAAQVAEILLFDETTSRNYFERYQHGGDDALLGDNYSGAEPIYIIVDNAGYYRYYKVFEEFKPACKSFFRKRKKYLPELQTLLTENFHIQAA